MMQFPASVGLSECKYGTRTNTQVSQTENFRTLTRSKGGQAFEFSVSTELLDPKQARQLFVFMAQQKGQYGTFTIVLPELSHSYGTQDTDPEVKITTLAGSNQISMRALKTSETGVLQTGDFIQFANHSKCYLITQDVNSSASGLGTLNIYPTLREDVPAATEIRVNNVPFQVAFDKDFQQVTRKASSPKQRVKFMLEERFR